MKVIAYLNDLKIAKINNNKVVVVDKHGELDVRTIINLPTEKVFYKNGKRYELSKALYLQ